MVAELLELVLLAAAFDCAAMGFAPFPVSACPAVIACPADIP
jgi:hypothetical protein